MAAGMTDLASLFKVDYLRVVPESNFSSRVEEAFDSCPSTPAYDCDANSYHDDLIEACRRGDLSAVKEGLLRFNVVPDDKLKKLAEVAATRNDREILNHLIQEGQTVNEESKNLSFDSAAFIAAYCGHLEALTCLLDLGAVSDSVLDPTTDNCLHIAAARNHRHIVEELCSRNPRLAIGKNKAGLAPLHIAVLNGHMELLQYFLKNVCPPMIISRGGNTALHCACQNNQEHIAEFLITQIATDLVQAVQAKNKKGFLPIHFAAATGNLQLVRILTDHMERCNIPCNSMGDSSWTPLHCAAEAGHLEVVKHFCSHHKFKADACTTRRSNNISPLHSAALHGKRPILEYLLSSKKFPPDAFCQIFVFSNALHLAAYRGYTSCCQLLVDNYHLNPSSNTGSGFTAIHLAAGSGKIETLQYFVETKGHSPAIAQFNKITPLHVAAASGHADVVSWLLSTGKCDPNLPILITKATPLHLAAAAGDHECVKALTARRSSNPNAMAILGLTPLYCAATEVICWELIKRGARPTSRPDILDRYQFLQSWAQVLPSAKLFVVGASGAGKSTLVKSMQLEHKWILGRFFSVKGVDPHTAGIIPVDFESSKFGKVIIYDFAGQKEYYSNHEAILGKADQTLPIFLVVVDVQQEEEEVKRQISYWRKFIKPATCSIASTASTPGSPNYKPSSHAHLEEPGTGASCSPENPSKIILVGSHSDRLTTSEKASKQALLQATCEGDDDIRVVTIDCRMPASRSMTEIRNILQEFCMEAKPSLPALPHTHAVAAFLKHNFITACQLHEIKEEIRANGPPVTDLLEGLEEVLHNLSNVGSVLYLPDRKKPDNGWIILDQELILQGIHGYQKRVREMKLDTSSGVLSFQEVEKLFQQTPVSPKMVVRYLVHMEFCREIENQEILRALTRGDQQLDSRHFLFPDLIETDAPQGMWQEEGNFTCYSGFVFRCQTPEDFITPRFFHVLLLRIAFTFAAGNPDVPLQDCSLWKSGIYWVKIGIRTIVELTEGGRELLILCRSEERSKMDLIKHRAAVVWKVSEVIREFPAMSLDMLIIHPQDLRPPHPIVLSDQQTRVYKVQDLLQALMEAETHERQYVRRTFLESGRSRAPDQCHIDDILLFEPYSLIRGSQLGILNQHEECVKEQWLLDNIATFNMDKWKDTATVLGIGKERVQRIITQNQAADLCFMSVLSEWLQTFSNTPTFRDLRERLDQYSIFRGHNVETPSPRPQSNGPVPVSPESEPVLCDIST